VVGGVCETAVMSYVIRYTLILPRIKQRL
jgi:hypothetical protein